MKQFVGKTIVKISAAIVLCVVVSLIISSLAPHLSNDLALGQLENDDMSWTLMNGWYQIQAYSGWIYAVIGLVFGASISKDCYKYFKSREENV